MAENIKVEALDVKRKSTAEKEANSTRSYATNEDGDYNVDLGKTTKKQKRSRRTTMKLLKKVKNQTKKEQKEEPVLEEITEETRRN